MPAREPNSAHPDADQVEVIKGFVAYKNRIGLEIYGVGSVHFTDIISADNSIGVTVDWERRYSTNWTRVLIVGETENHGTLSMFYKLMLFRKSRRCQ